MAQPSAKLRNRSDSTYQGRAAQKDNPTQLIIKQAVDFLILQVEAGKSETLAVYLTAMARFYNYSFGNIVAVARQRAVTYCFTSLESIMIGFARRRKREMERVLQFGPV